MKSLPHEAPSPPAVTGRRAGFADDFRRFFVRGLAALLPTLITLAVIWWVLDFLWTSLGRHLIWVVKRVWFELARRGVLESTGATYVRTYWGENEPHTRVVGVLLAILLIYIVGMLIGNLIGRTFWRLGEAAVMRVPVVRAIYPAVKQVTDFLLPETPARTGPADGPADTPGGPAGQFRGSKVVAVRPHASGIWSIGLVTGRGPEAIDRASGEPTLSVFVPSSPTAISGYVMVVPRSQVVDLPMTVEEAMRLLVSGGVVQPGVVPPGVGGTAKANRTGPAPNRPPLASSQDATGSSDAGGAFLGYTAASAPVRRTNPSRPAGPSEHE